MEHWQFLIQKQGDRTWQTLESPTLQILAGKYRVLARSHLLNTDVEVRVTHSSIQEVPPKRRIFKRMRRTNADGLMAVIPFTDLKQGIWELRCSGDLMTDMLGQSWQYSLLIKVLPEEVTERPYLGDSGQFDSELEVKLFPHDESAITSLPSLDINTLLTETEDIIIDQPVSPVLFKGETAEQLLQSLIDLALPNPESPEEDPALEDFDSVSPPPLIQLYLEQDIYISRWGKTLTLNGGVNLADHLEEQRLSISSVNQLQLVIELRSPLESNILTQFSQSLPNKILPFTFTTSIDIPTECESKLILAEINLYGAVNNEERIQLLGSRTFTITADVSELLSVTFPKSNTPDQLTESNKPPDPVNATDTEKPIKVSLELFNVAKTPKLAQFHILKPSANKPLPPRIKSEIVWDGVSPELPKLPQINKNQVVESLLSEGAIKKTSKIAPINLEKLVIKQVKTGFPYLKRLKPDLELEQETQIQLANSPEIQLAKTENTLELLPSYESEDESRVMTEFPLLDTEELITTDTPAQSPLIQKWMENQGYFLPEGITLEYQDDSNDRDQSHPESALTLSTENQAVETELYLSLDAEIEEPEQEIPEHLRLDLDEPTPEQEQPQNIPSWLSQEIVMDDIYITDSHEDKNQPLAEQQSELVNLSPTLPKYLPTPQLFLPGGELLAGTSIKLRLELSEVGSGLAIKLWVEDYQTRALLDGPHLLKDLRPTPWGNWEAITQLIVPFGCLEILVGAIALDLTNQQESHKVTTVKTVIPPNLPSMQLDELLDL
ncbi:hypothetical protein A0J48_015845 [Sphaerospermopsis aphanizomenoides BCCUSP55]|uniref:hypothetical protein n=1 Tax=Sphaerospermopsis aphanizomenoides TaxID=459663 RepID=UPI001904C7F7|nr:hypothetical protein [Sphaerospermopsis aphanizomenoides]MBK1988993.1 hypothetical protein [Sphaerospermopsis aphanizomenoides BCCUSP55]